MTKGKCISAAPSPPIGDMCLNRDRWVANCLGTKQPPTCTHTDNYPCPGFLEKDDPPKEESMLNIYAAQRKSSGRYRITLTNTVYLTKDEIWSTDDETPPEHPTAVDVVQHLRYHYDDEDDLISDMGLGRNAEIEVTEE